MAKKKGIVTFTLAVSFEYDDTKQTLQSAGEEVTDVVRCGINKHTIHDGVLITDEFMHDEVLIDECE